MWPLNVKRNIWMCNEMTYELKHMALRTWKLVRVITDGWAPFSHASREALRVEITSLLNKGLTVVI